MRETDPRSENLLVFDVRRANLAGQLVASLGQFLDVDDATSQQLCRALDFLVEHDEEILRWVCFSVATQLNREGDFLLFDTTGTYFTDPTADAASGFGGRRPSRPSAPARR